MLLLYYYFSYYILSKSFNFPSNFNLWAFYLYLTAGDFREPPWAPYMSLVSRLFPRLYLAIYLTRLSSL